ncbi:ATP-grasp domain-containing protein [Spirilliplanes yamanashiensis]|uniref:ATP-grasp domain-containing protein n=1 Tax=Spirilliplanes yamanashiensis TaxID=42233 RepID=A0A8J4DM66_9ACTN|nr:ATP-grasp domain-containing protein [Spirilliplanes yamanashiensis]MDP9816308.1 hypothetical protein [Spirilliplanes yamanashiensis]GIJ05835.1 hypothetical protein Sya03_51870 [Spirilliplanes yamanashiensis]
MTAVVFPADPLRPRRVDEHFRAEADAAREAGARVLLDSAPGAAEPAWYRGWMLTPERYAALPFELCTTPDMYRRAHELPGWYPVFAAVTPASVWLPPGAPLAGLPAAAAALGDGPFVVKDYVKSRKHEWDSACFAPDAGRLPAVAATFAERQEDFLAGNVVVRAFESFTGPEVRVWWLDGEPVLTGPHPDGPPEVPEPPLGHVAPLVRELGCRFVTTDLALRADGVWRVVEVGDGQVSELPSVADPAVLFAALVAAAGR